MAPNVKIDAGPVDWPALAVHGGAGSYERVAGDPVLAGRLADGIDAALDAGWDVLAAGGDPLEAVVAAVRAMEEHGEFNAGRGAVPTTSGAVEMDGSVMDDRGRAGAVACLTGFSAVAAARAVALARDAAPPGAGALILAGSGADDFAATAGVPRLHPLAELHGDEGAGAADPTPMAPLPPLSAQGTVGAVAVAADGRFAAATSTGGRAGQPPGRVGDTPVPGAGVWAEAGCSVSATGAGEAFVLAGFSRLVGRLHTGGADLGAALTEALAEVATRGGDGGAVALGRDRTWAAGYDTRAMARGVRHAGGRRRAITD